MPFSPIPRIAHRHYCPNLSRQIKTSFTHPLFQLATYQWSNEPLPFSFPYEQRYHGRRCSASNAWKAPRYPEQCPWRKENWTNVGLNLWRGGPFPAWGDAWLSPAHTENGLSCALHPGPLRSRGRSSWREWLALHVGSRLGLSVNGPRDDHAGCRPSQPVSANLETFNLVNCVQNSSALLAGTKQWHHKGDISNICCDISPRTLEALNEGKCRKICLTDRNRGNWGPMQHHSPQWHWLFFSVAAILRFDSRTRYWLSNP